MSRPKWTEAVAAQEEKVAIALKTDDQGRTRVVGVGTGAEAEKMVAQAHAHGVEVKQDAEQVEQLTQSEDADDEGVPEEIYELMSEVINFALELNEQWLSEGAEEEVA